MSNQAGKGDKLRKGANLEKFRNNYNNIFNRCQYCGSEEYQVTDEFGKVCTHCIHEIENGK